MIAWLNKYRMGYVPAICWFVFCTILLCLPGSSLPTYGWLANFPSLDKWIHTGFFGIQVILLSLGFRSQHINADSIIKSIALFAISALVYGIAIEYIQEAFISNRSFDVRDIWADALGSLIGGLISVIVLGKK